MRTSSPLLLLGTLGALTGAVGSAAAAVDTSQWKCESCPFETGASGSVDVGVGAVSDASAKFGDYTGLDQQRRPSPSPAARLRYRGDDGLYGSLTASDLGLDSRSLAAEAGREGRYALRLGYAELPRHFSDTATDALPRHRRRGAVAAGRLSGGQHGGDAARCTLQPGRHRLQALAPGRRGRLARHGALDASRERAPRGARRHAAQRRLVLLEHLAAGRAGGPDHRPARAVDRPTPAPAGRRPSPTTARCSATATTR